MNALTINVGISLDTDLVTGDGERESSLASPRTTPLVALHLHPIKHPVSFDLPVHFTIFNSIHSLINDPRYSSRC